jgi:uncharacterized protein (DUF433 family)
MASDTPVESRPRVSIEHIALDERGRARLAGHRIKVRHIIGLMRAQGYTAEQLQSEAYPHLSLGQIYAALAYYHDHREQIDREIEEEEEFFERERQKQLADPKHQELVAKMKARWEQLHGGCQWPSQEASGQSPRDP